MVPETIVDRPPPCSRCQIEIISVLKAAEQQLSNKRTNGNRIRDIPAYVRSRRWYQVCYIVDYIELLYEYFIYE